MSRRRYDKGDVKWLAPTAKSYKARALAWSTKAASDLIVALLQEYDTIQEVHDHITYDVEARAVLQAYIDKGYGDYIARDLFK
ncbi:MAG: hypothetical protein LIO60_00670 [Oscillospiraceae bacterium]|nr:hypothetical protein [Oscillospiraceae bacterium]